MRLCSVHIVLDRTEVKFEDAIISHRGLGLCVLFTWTHASWACAWPRRPGPRHGSKFRPTPATIYPRFAPIDDFAITKLSASLSGVSCTMSGLPAVRKMAPDMGHYVIFGVWWTTWPIKLKMFATIQRKFKRIQGWLFHFCLVSIPLLKQFSTLTCKKSFYH
jgi:hypothetical protein